MARLIEPDLKMAQRFLDILELDGHFWYQTAIEPKPEDGNSFPRALQGNLGKVGQQLVQLNETGSAVWVQINAGIGRSNLDVNRIRAYFVDQDQGSPELLFNAAVPADIIVESSPGNHHGYWLTGNAPLGQFSERMHVLADKFNGDHAICHLARVMRLPGFFHLKGEPFMSRIVKIRDGL
jgi:hypothetical protein